MSKPVVSICSITYNHATYIRQCLDGFLMQKTNFPFEIIINDDCSTDGTTEIIKEYVAKYPNLIKPIFHDENQYQKGVRGMFAKFVFPKAQGKYIALCEGDDYWIDPLKLQKQVDFMDAHPDYSMCFHENCRLIGDVLGKEHFRYKKSQTVPIEDVILGGGLFCPTASLMFSVKYIENVPSSVFNLHVGDYPLQIYLASKGKVFYMHDIMCVYRFMSENSWTFRTNKNMNFKLDVINKELVLLDTMNKVTDNKFNDVFEQRKNIYLFYQYLGMEDFSNAKKYWQKIHRRWRYTTPISYLKMNGFSKIIKIVKRVVKC